MATKKTKVEAEDSAETNEQSEELITPTHRAEVDSVAKLLKGLNGKLEVGSLYEFTYHGIPVATVDSTQEGKIVMMIAPSKWAVQVAEEMWQYQVDEASTVDPTTVDVLTEGWCATFLTEVPRITIIVDEEEPVLELEQVLSEMASDSEAEVEAQQELL